MGRDDDAWRLKIEARLSAQEVVLAGLAAATGTRADLASALEDAAHRLSRTGSDREFGNALREACLEIARELREHREDA